jgi:hypothetical protein
MNTLTTNKFKENTFLLTKAKGAFIIPLYLLGKRALLIRGPPKKYFNQ